MNTMMLALLQDRLWTTAAQLQARLRTPAVDDERRGDGTADELSQVLQALDAVDRGRYGLCRECDRPMEPDQLLLKPHRLVCVDCERHGALAARALLRSLGAHALPH